MKIVLASASPRRKELLEKLGLSFTLRAAEKEEQLRPGMDIVSEVARVSESKALSVIAEGDELIISADTVVDVDGSALGKPHSVQEAHSMLRLLSGRSHLVHTAVTVRLGSKIQTHVETAAVTFRSLTDGEIHSYISSGEPMDKAGAYGAQGLGALLVSRVDGDFFTVMGLPVCALGQMLKGFGLELLAK